jgi:hypothetical protein
MPGAGVVVIGLASVCYTEYSLKKICIQLFLPGHGPGKR